jgi:NAD(P)H dehydrogenase (quinone)
MHVLLIYAHPEPNSFTVALLGRAKEVLEADGHSFEVSDLYAEKFDPVVDRHDFTSVANSNYFSIQNEQAFAEEHRAYSEDIRREQQRASRADLFIFLFPLWWGGPPAIIKGWFDRVMSYGFGYVDGARYDRGLFRGRSAMICVPTGGTSNRFSEGSTYGSIGKVLWSLRHCAINYLGLTLLDDFIAYATPRVDETQRRIYLDNWADHLRVGLKQAAVLIAQANR